MLIMITKQIDNNETIPSDLKKYRNLETDIKDLSKAKDELIAEIASLMSIRQWLATSVVSLTFRVSQYLNFMIDIIKCTRVQVQVHVLHLIYLLYHEPPIMYNKEQELNVDKISMRSDNYQKFLPLINSANGDDIEFKILKSALVDAILIGLDKLRSSNSQDTDDDKYQLYYDGCFKPGKNCIRTVPRVNLIVNVLNCSIIKNIFVSKYF